MGQARTVKANKTGVAGISSRRLETSGNQQEWLGPMKMLVMGIKGHSSDSTEYSLYD
ncbi:hypothetical protein GJ744_000639 [Endocarpon pusillum]|uniref:Uncharacterized protein n=1 Tax=Endocarpon pusillum TaxID=364733 RepID=A0A8H7ACJ8_9EURO|nr:hypothetical protein GJ744_000639 [Endocarpon pusillum]